MTAYSVVLACTSSPSWQPEADVAAGGGWSETYERLYRRYMAVEVLLGALVLLAVFFMAAKP